MIWGNSPLQEGFAPLQVKPTFAPTANGTPATNGVEHVYVIEALLDLAIQPAANDLFDARFAACECIKAYFFDHLQIRAHFLQRAIEGHMSGQDETANVLTTLMSGSQGSQTIDPYRIWFAATLVFHLIYDDHDAKNLLMQVVEGDAERGEEVVTCIQTLTANLIGSFQLGEDERISIAYLTLLCGWLFDDAAGVNDFLGEASSLQSLVQIVLRAGNDHIVVKGLCATLLGIIYEFSTKDSPVPRRDLQPILTQHLGREKYLDAISQLRQHPDVREFEVLAREPAIGGSLPDVYFDATFVDFLKDNFSRLSRTIDRDPGLEIHKSHEGIDRDLVDTLRGQIDEKTQALEKIQAQLMTMQQRLDQEQAEHKRTKDDSLKQLSMIKKINEDLHNNHDAETQKLERDHRQKVLDLENRQSLQIAALNNQVQQVEKDKNVAISKIRQEHDQQLHEATKARADLEQRLSSAHANRQEALDTIRNFEQTQRRTKDEIAVVQETISSLKSSLQDSETQIKKLKSEKDALQGSIDKLKTENQDLRSRMQDQTWKVKDAEDKLRKSELSVKEKEEARAAAQTELDDLLIILGDLEDKRTKDKVSTLQSARQGPGLTFCRNVLENSAKRCQTPKRTTRTMMKRRKTKKMMRLRDPKRSHRFPSPYSKSAQAFMDPPILDGT